MKYNFGSETTKSMYEITRKFVDDLGIKLAVEDAPARHNLWMDCTKAKKKGVHFSEIADALLRCAVDNNFQQN